ncbi:MAG: hypothetical protein V1820_00910 [archaeon]
MADTDGKIPFVGKRGTSVPTGGGWENLPMAERLRQTFERGVTRVELDLADAYNKKIMPGHVPDAQKRISKQIATEFGGSFSVHAPYQVDFASIGWGQRIEAAEVMRQSIRYAKDMGAHYVTFHPTANLSGAAFQDPFTWQATPVPAHLMMRDKQEFDSWCDKNHISQNSPIYQKLRTEAGIMFNAQSMQFTQHYAASAPLYASEFGKTGALMDAQEEIAQQLKKGVTDPEEIRQQVGLKLGTYFNSANPDVQRGARASVENLVGNREEFVKALENVKAHLSKSSPEAFIEYLEDVKKRKWQLATMAAGGRINLNGSTAEQDMRYEHMGDEKHDLFMYPKEAFASPEQFQEYLNNFKNTGEADSKKRYNFANAMTLNRQIDLSGADLGSDAKNTEAREATESWIKNLKETFRDVFKNPAIRRDIEEGKIVLSAENLWGVNPELGVTDAAGYFNKAEHMIQAVEELRKVAAECGMKNPEQHIKMTFDTEHAAIGTQQNPTEFINEMKRQGKEDMIGHVHLVGGGSTASIFGHKGFGSIEDDVARKNPELLKRLVELGVPLTIEPGSGGIKDVEGGLETLLLGAPMDVLQAANTPGIKGGAEEQLIRNLGYTGMPTPAYGGMRGSSGYFADFASQNAGLITKSLYSFGPSLAQPFRATYSTLASPSLYQGGISHQMPGTNIWGGSQPMIYSMKNKE